MKRRDLLALGLGTLAFPVMAGARPRVSIIMDDLGYREGPSWAATTLNPAITLAVLPHTFMTDQLVLTTQRTGHEVMLHMPMQAQNGKAMGTGGLSLDMDEATTRSTLKAAFDSVANARGFNNHMGSAYSLDQTRLDWVMGEARDRVDYFVDSLTVGASKAELAARAAGLRATRRDVFLDDQADPLKGRPRLQELRRPAEKIQVAICHPHPETLALLVQEWAWIEDHFEVVPASMAAV